jgi:hypothetical protein
MSLGQKSGTVTPVDQSLSRDFLNPALELLHHNAVESVVVPVEDLFTWTNLYTSPHHLLTTSLANFFC